MKEKFKSFGSKLVAGVTAVGTALGASITALAEDTTNVASQMQSAVTAGAQQASNSIVSMLGTVAPIIIGVVVGVIVLIAGIKWIKKIRSNAG